MILKFDAFVFRVELDIAIVCQLFENIGFSLPAGSPRFGYRYCYELELGGLKHGLIQYGGDSVGTGVYVQVMGSHSGRVRDVVLAAGWSGHLIRADIALDFNGAKYFKKLSSDLVELAKTKNLKTSTVGDWVQGVGGRTLYVGSRTSAFMVRLYEKYKQKGVDTGGEETIRLELEIKPYKHARLSAFALTADQLVGSSSIYSPIYEKYLKLSDGITLNNLRKETSHESALRQMVIQYQNTLKKELEIHSGCVYSLFLSLTKHENWKND